MIQPFRVQSANRFAPVGFYRLFRGRKNRHPMSAPLIKNSIQIRNELERLGVTREKLLEVAWMMHRVRTNCTDNDAPFAAGVYSYCAGTRGLRDALTPLGWTKDETNQVSSCYNAELGIRISVANTDDGTGLEDRIPENSSQKGVATRRLISESQLLMESVLENAQNVIALANREHVHVKHYFLCVWSDGDSEMRAELSRPTDCSSGYFSEFNHRILISIPQDGDDGVKIKKVSPDTPEFDITIKRKSA